MQFTLDRAALIKALAHLQSVVEKRNTIPILANLMLSVQNGHLTLTATDMEIAVVEEVAASTSADGATTAPAVTLYEIARRLPDDAVIAFDHSGGDAPLKVSAGSYTTSLMVLPVEDFPAMTAGDLPHHFSLPAKTLRGLIDHTRFAISQEETRYYLNGVYLHSAEVEGVALLRAVATDGHRLARVEEPLPEGASGMPGVIVPRKTVFELRKLLEETNDNVEVALSETRILFHVGPVTLTSKLIDGTFPEYERVIPHDNDKVLTVHKQDFSAAVARVAAISTERARPVKLTLSPHALVLSATSPEQGTASEELGADRVTYDAAPLEIGFQARYLSDITDQIEGDVEFRFADGTAPTIVRDATDQNALYVLMPIRV